MSEKAAILEQLVIKPTLSYLGVETPAACKLLLGTAASETGLRPGHNTKLGIYGISPEQHRKVWDKYLAFDPELASKVRCLASRIDFLRDPDRELCDNLAYATAIAWLIYRASEAAIPADCNRRALAKLWRRCFHRGKAAGWQLPAAAT